MEPVEINAGAYYLRALRADRAIDDRPALLSAFTDEQMRKYVAAYRLDDLDAATDYVQRRGAEWREDERYSWAVAEPTTGTLLAEVGINGIVFTERRGDVACWTHPDHRGRGVLVTVLPVVLRFGYQALGLHHISYRHAASNLASARLAKRCGFRRDGRLREATWVDGVPEDLILWSKLSTDLPAAGKE